MTGKHVRITLGPPSDTTIVIDGIVQRDVAEFALRHKVPGDRGDELPTLELTRVLVPLVHEDIEIEGLANVVERFEDESRKAAERHEIALQSFWLHERGDKTLDTLADIVRDAKRFRAIAAALAEGNAIVVENMHGAEVDSACTPDALASLADHMRKQYGAKLANPETSGDTGQEQQPEKPHHADAVDEARRKD